MSTKRVADVVFCIDASGSMSPCFDAVRKNVGAFVSGLTSHGQGTWDLRLGFLSYATGGSGRGCLFEFKSLQKDNMELIEALYRQTGDDGFFTRDVEEFKKGLAKLSAGGDEASFVALDVALDFPWRRASECHRVIIVLTDEALETGVVVSEQVKLIPDLIAKIHALKVLLFLVGPESDAYNQISAADKSEYKAVTDAHVGLVGVDFGKVLDAIAKSVSVNTLQTAHTVSSAKRGLFGQAGWVGSSGGLSGS